MFKAFVNKTTQSIAYQFSFESENASGNWKNFIVQCYADAIRDDAFSRINTWWFDANKECWEEFSCVCWSCSLSTLNYYICFFYQRKWIRNIGVDFCQIKLKLKFRKQTTWNKGLIMVIMRYTYWKNISTVKTKCHLILKLYP